jgi:large subunit ribosomal protein L24
MKIKKNDIVKILTGDHKGKTGKVLSVLPQVNGVTIEGIGELKRRIKPTKLSPQGGTKEIHRPLHISKVALVHPSDSAKTTRVGHVIKKDGTKVRVARQGKATDKNKEIK